jgi:exodeoxyribonuclease-3
MREKNVGWRIDYVLAEASLAERATTCEVSREFGKSDHAPLTVSFDFTA